MTCPITKTLRLAITRLMSAGWSRIHRLRRQHRLPRHMKIAPARRLTVAHLRLGTSDLLPPGLLRVVSTRTIRIETRALRP